MNSVKKVEIKDLDTLKIQKGDIVLVRPKFKITDAHKAAFNKWAKNAGEHFGVQFMFVENTVELSVLRKEKNEDKNNPPVH